MPAVQETVDQVRRIDVDQYKYGFETTDRIRQGPEGPDRRTPSASSRRRRTSRPGCSNGGSTPIGAGSPCASRNGRRSTTGRSTTRTPTIIRRRSNFKAPKSLDDIDPEILKTYEKLGIPLREREALLGIVREEPRRIGEDGEPPRRATASRSTRCSTPSRSPPPSRKS